MIILDYEAIGLSCYLILHVYLKNNLPYVVKTTSFSSLGNCE